jgi:hypothetical protein
MTHGQVAAYLIPSVPPIPQFHSVVFVMPREFTSWLTLAASIHARTFLHPPGYLSGRTICQKESFLRI